MDWTADSPSCEESGISSFVCGKYQGGKEGASLALIALVSERFSSASNHLHLYVLRFPHKKSATSVLMLVAMVRDGLRYFTWRRLSHFSDDTYRDRLAPGWRNMKDSTAARSTRSGHILRKFSRS